MRTVLLLHAGIADSRMWEPQVEVLRGAGYRVIAPDLRGFGERRLEPGPFSHVRDAEAALDGPAAVVGCSLGGRVALELALHRPDLVERLVLIAPGLPGWDWSEETRAGWAAEEAAYEAGDVEAAAEASTRMWVDGPNRSPHEVDPGIRAALTGMVLRSYEMQQGAWEEGAREEEVLDAPIGDRLKEIGCPALVLVGEEDVADMLRIAAHVAEAIEDARLVTIAKRLTCRVSSAPTRSMRSCSSSSVPGDLRRRPSIHERGIIGSEVGAEDLAGEVLPVARLPVRPYGNRPARTVHKTRLM